MDNPVDVTALPVRPIVCVRGGMGLGKTKAVQRLLNEHCTQDMKVLIVTFSRALAGKMKRDFPYFMSYQEVTGDITCNKIIVCLDSLWRVKTRNFNYIIIDEAVSVFLHFDSDVMQKSTENSTLLELLLSQAGSHTYFLDACMDMTFMKHIVDYFCNARSVQPYWIWNASIRPTNRHAIVRIKYGNGKAKISEDSLTLGAARKVCELLREGKRVIVRSSTKSFTGALDAFV